MCWQSARCTRITCTAGESYAEAIREIVVAIPCPPVGCLEEIIRGGIQRHSHNSLFHAAHDWVGRSKAIFSLLTRCPEPLIPFPRFKVQLMWTCKLDLSEEAASWRLINLQTFVEHFLLGPSSKGCLSWTHSTVECIGFSTKVECIDLHEQLIAVAFSYTGVDLWRSSPIIPIHNWFGIPWHSKQTVGSF